MVMSLERSLKAEIVLGAKNGRDTSIFQLLAASNFCKKAINSIYPETQNPGVNRRYTIKSFSLMVGYTTLKTWLE